jgi:hypothetical protein
MSVKRKGGSQAKQRTSCKRCPRPAYPGLVHARRRTNRYDIEEVKSIANVLAPAVTLCLFAKGKGMGATAVSDAGLDKGNAVRRIGHCQKASQPHGGPGQLLKRIQEHYECSGAAGAAARARMLKRALVVGLERTVAPLWPRLEQASVAHLSRAIGLLTWRALQGLFAIRTKWQAPSEHEEGNKYSVRPHHTTKGEAGGTVRLTAAGDGFEETRSRTRVSLMLLSEFVRSFKTCIDLYLFAINCFMACKAGELRRPECDPIHAVRFHLNAENGQTAWKRPAGSRMALPLSEPSASAWVNKVVQGGLRVRREMCAQDREWLCASGYNERTHAAEIGEQDAEAFQQANLRKHIKMHSINFRSTPSQRDWQEACKKVHDSAKGGNKQEQSHSRRHGEYEYVNEYQIRRKSQVEFLSLPLCSVCHLLVSR